MTVRINATFDFNARDIQRARRELNALQKQLSTLDARIARTGQAFRQFGQQATRVGGQMTRRLTMPIAAVGAYSVKTAAEFGDSIAKIQGLVGVAASDIGALEDAARNLGPAYGVSANEAAEALFFITSAGLRGSTAIETLEASLKASAIGMGETATISDLTTSALNAYGEEVLSASDATDVLTNAVRLGKLEPAALADTMGFVLPIASALGVSFDQVGAAMAAMSRTGTDASTAAVQLRQILAAILNPTVEARNTMEDYGLSAQGLREQLREQGLLSVLTTLTERFGDNEEAAAQVFGNIRALAGVLDLMGANVETTQDIFDSMTDSTGILDEAFGIASDTAGFQFRQALAEVQGALLDLGNEVMPFALDLTRSLQGLVERFNELSDAQQGAIIKAAGWTAVAGPALSVTGNLALTMGGLASGIGAIAAGGPAAIAVLAGIAALGVIGVGVALVNADPGPDDPFGENSILGRGLSMGGPATAAQIAAGRQRQLNEAYEEEARLLRERFLNPRLNDAMDAEAERFAGMAQRERDLRAQAEAQAAAAAAAEAEAAAAQAAADAEQRLRDAMKGTEEQTVRLTDEMRENLQTINLLYAGTGETGDALAQFARDVLTVGFATEDTERTLTGLADAIRSELSDALSAAESRLGAAQQAFDAYRDSIAGGIRSGNTLADAARDQSAAIQRLTRAQQDYADAQASGDPEQMSRAAAALAEAEDEQRTFNDFLSQNADTALAFADQIDALRTAGASLAVTQEIAQLGAETGGRIVAELLAGGAEAIERANELTAVVERASIRAGQAAAEQFYGAGVRAAEALVEGLRSEMDRLDDVLSEIVSKIAAAFKTPDTPSAPAETRTTRNDTAPTPRPAPTTAGQPLPDLPPGLRWGSGGLPSIRMMADGGLVTGPTLGIVGEAGPELVLPLDRLDDYGATTVNITVTSADPQAVVEAIRRYTRSNGPLGGAVRL